MLTRWLAVSAVLLLVAYSALAQQKGDVTYVEVIRVKPGMEDQFEATLKLHWGWHKKKGEQWSYFVWTIDSGKNEGAYQIASFGHNWEEVDTSNGLLTGTPNPEENPEQFHLNVQESYYRYRTDLSMAPPLIEPLPVASVTHIMLRPEAVHDFETALKKINEARSKTGRRSEIQGRWYELVIGGDWPQFLLLEDRANWASFQNRGQLDAIVKNAYGKQVGEDVLNTFWHSIHAIYAETMHYHPDLSRLVNPN